MNENFANVGFLYHFYVIADYRKGNVGKTERDVIEAIKARVLENVKDIYEKKIKENEIEVLAALHFGEWLVIGVKVGLVKTALKRLPIRNLNSMHDVNSCEVVGAYTVLLYRSSIPIPQASEINRYLESFYPKHLTDTFANTILEYKTGTKNVLMRFGAEEPFFLGVNIPPDSSQTGMDLSGDIERSLSDIFLHYTIVRRLFEKYDTEMKHFYGPPTPVQSLTEEPRGCTKSGIEELVRHAQQIRIEDTDAVENYLTSLMDYLMLLDSKHTYLNGVQNEVNNNTANLDFYFSLLEPSKYLAFPSLQEDIIRECELIKTGYKNFIAEVARYEDTLNNVVNLIRGRLETQYLKTQLLCSKESINLTKASEKSKESIELLTLVFASFGLAQVVSAFLIFWLESDRQPGTVINAISYCIWSLVVPLIIVALVYLLIRKRRRSSSG